MQVALGNAFDALDLNVDADAVHEEHHAFDGGPIEWIDIFCEVGVEDERGAGDENVEREEEADEGGAEHEIG